MTVALPASFELRRVNLLGAAERILKRLALHVFATLFAVSVESL